MSDFTRGHLFGAQDKARDVLDVIDCYIDARSCAAGVLHMPECKLHVAGNHWEWLNNSLKRGPNNMSLENSTYRGLWLVKR